MSDTYIPQEVRDRVRQQADNRCGYCLCPLRLLNCWLEIDHIIPRADGGADDEKNLWLACRVCNGYKGSQTTGLDSITGRRVRLFDPRRQRWSDHFALGKGPAIIVGKTPCGRATVEALQLNNVLAVGVRQEWLSVGWHPPKDVD